MRDHRKLAHDAYLRTGALLQENQLVDALATAELGLRHAVRTRDRRVIGSSVRARADVYDAIGDEQRARRGYADAGQWQLPWIEDRAWTTFKQGLFVLDLSGSPADRAREAVPIIEQALELTARSDPAAQAQLAEQVTGAHLNLAYACRHFDLPRAEKELALLDAETRQHPNTRLVEAQLAVARRDRARAEQILAELLAAKIRADYTIELRVELGLLAAGEGRPKEAEDHLRAACAAVEEVREENESLDLRPWILARRRRPYEELFALLARQPDRGLEALDLAMSLQARSFLDAMVQVDERLPAAHGAAVQQTLAAAPPSWLAPAGTDDPAARLRQLEARLRDREVLVFVEALGSIWRLHAIGGAVNVTELPASTAASVETWLQKPDDLAAASVAGAALLPASLAAIAAPSPPSPDDGAPPLYIIAGGRLDRLPFSGLRSGDRYVIDQRTIIRLPGLAAQTCRPRSAASEPPLFVGDAAGNLPAARGEVTRLHQRFGGALAVGDDATLTALDRAAASSLLHIAVHGGVGSSGGLLELADGSLDGSDVLRRKLAPAVVVLAGCATSASRDPEGWRALPTAFLIAGSHAVVATVRSVGDADAARVMQELYAHDARVHPSQALAEAQRALAAKQMPPSAWASFAAWQSGCD